MATQSNSDEKKAGFTPWEISTRAINWPALIKRFIKTPSGVSISIEHRVRGTENPQPIEPEKIKEVEEITNLIAAAPEMYEALQWVVGSMALERVERFDILSKCKAALQKAGGAK